MEQKKEVKFVERLYKSKEQLTGIFKNKFHFSEEQIVEYVNRIITQSKEDLVYQLTDAESDFFTRLSNITGEAQGKAIMLAKTAVEKTLKIYLEYERKIREDALFVLQELKEMGADPFKFLKAELFNEADTEKFEETLNVLSSYTFDVMGNQMVLFDEKEVISLFESCNTLLFKTERQNTQSILDTLSLLMFDEKTNSYIANPVDIIRQVPTLLTLSAETIDSNLDFLEKRFVKQGGMQQLDLARAIAKTPSILTCSPNNIILFEKEYMKVVESVIKEDKKGKITNPRQIRDAVSALFDDITKINTIAKITAEDVANLSSLKKVLLKHFKPEIAVKCLLDLNFVKCDYKVLDYLICRLGQEQKKTGKPYLKYLVEHPSRVFNGNMSIDGETEKASAPTTKSGKKPRAKLVLVNEKILSTATAEMIEHARTRCSRNQLKEVDELVHNAIDGMERKVEVQQTPVKPVDVTTETPRQEEPKPEEVEEPKEKEPSAAVLAVQKLEGQEFGDVYEEIITRVLTACRHKNPNIYDNGSTMLGINLDKVLAAYKPIVGRNIVKSIQSVYNDLPVVVDALFDNLDSVAYMRQMNRWYQSCEIISKYNTDFTQAFCKIFELTKDAKDTNLSKIYKEKFLPEKRNIRDDLTEENNEKRVDDPSKLTQKDLEKLIESKINFYKGQLSVFSFIKFITSIIASVDKNFGEEGKLIIPESLRHAYKIANQPSLQMNIGIVVKRLAGIERLRQRMFEVVPPEQRLGRSTREILAISKTMIEHGKTFIEKDLLMSFINIIDVFEQNPDRLFLNKEGLYYVFPDRAESNRKEVLCYPRDEFINQLDGIGFPSFAPEDLEAKGYYFLLGTNEAIVRDVVFENITEAKKFMENPTELPEDLQTIHINELRSTTNKSGDD